jgi:hypothetical protein
MRYVHTDVRRILAMTPVLLYLSCASQHPSQVARGAAATTHEVNACTPCDIPLANGVVLSPREQCWLSLIKQRCGLGDECLVDCFSNAKHRVRVDGRLDEHPIGGGCWHVCQSEGRRTWVEPVGWSDCSALDSRLPSQPAGQS